MEKTTTPTIKKRFLTTKEAAELLGLAPNTLSHSRVSGKLGGTKAPSHIKKGRLVRYRLEDIEAWLDQE